MKRVSSVSVAVCFSILLTSQAAPPKGGVIRAPRIADSTVKVDGDLKDWSVQLVRDNQKIVLTKANGFINAGTIDNDKDFSATTYALYDAGNLYIAVEVTDDATEKGFAGGNNWQNDCVEIWIDGANDGGTMPDNGGADADNYQLNVDVKGEPFVYRNDGAANILKEIKSAAAFQGTNYTLEVQIPYTAIPEFKLKAEAIIGFAVSFVDSDKAVWNHILWQGDKENAPDQWGDLVFASEPLAVRPQGRLARTWGRLKAEGGRQ